MTVPTTATILDVILLGLSETFLLYALLKNLVTAFTTLAIPCGFYYTLGSSAKRRSLVTILVILEREIG